MQTIQIIISDLDFTINRISKDSSKAEEKLAIGFEKIISEVIFHAQNKIKNNYNE